MYLRFPCIKKRIKLTKTLFQIFSHIFYMFSLSLFSPILEILKKYPTALCVHV